MLYIHTDNKRYIHIYIWSYIKSNYSTHIFYLCKSDSLANGEKNIQNAIFLLGKSHKYLENNWDLRPYVTKCAT